MLSVREFAAEANLPESTVRELCRTGQLAARRYGKSWRISQRELDPQGGCGPKESERKEFQR